MKVLVVSKVPTHPVNAGNRSWLLAQSNLLKKLGHEVHFLYISYFGYRQTNKEIVSEEIFRTQEYWGNRFHIYKVEGIEKFWISIKRKYVLFTRHGFITCDYIYPQGLTKYVNTLQDKEKFDVCFVNYFFLTKLFEKCSIQKKALFTIDCFTFRSLHTGIEEDLQLMPNEEAKAMLRSPYIFALQEEEAFFFKRLSPRSKVFTVYSLYDYRRSPIVGNKNIVFLSSDNVYNVRGIKWFIKEVFPSILSKHPDACLMIGGGICKMIEDCASENVKLLGFVNTPSDLYDLGDIAINPVSEGAGIKTKTFESISFDKVTIVHPHSLQGIYNKSEAPLLIAEKVSDWVELCEKAWSSQLFMEKIKDANKLYLQKMNKHIENEYSCFLNN